MSSEVKILSTNFMEKQSENESLRARIREIEDENQELRAQNLTQNRTIVEMRNDIVLMRIQLTEMADTSALLRERVRTLTQNIQQRQENDGSFGQITAPPLLAPPPIPPPLPPTRVRITPRQVGAGEALTTPLGVSLSSPPRHRIKRDYRQGFSRSTRPPFRRFDPADPGPSSPSAFLTNSERPNYFVGLRIIPQFQTSFVCTPNQSSGYSDSASDSSGSDENPQMFKKVKSKLSDGETTFKKASPISKDFELLKNVRNLHPPKFRQSILQNYNLSLPNTNSKFFFPIHWERKNLENSTMPSTSGNEVRFPLSPNPGTSTERNISKISDCVQYTFPTIHEGLHQSGIQSVVTNTGQPSRLRKLKKNIPYSRPESGKDSITKETEDSLSKLVNLSNSINTDGNSLGVQTDSFSSMEEVSRARMSQTILLGELYSDVEQDGFQADESSNCMTSNENSLEKISISESNVKKES